MRKHFKKFVALVIAAAVATGATKFYNARKASLTGA